MKHIFLLLSLAFALNSFSQAEDENFYLNDSKITWQKAFSTKKTQAEVYAYFEKSKKFDVFKIENNQIFAKLKPHATDPKKTGVAAVPAIVNKNDFKGMVVIQYRPKEKDYLVTMTDMLLVGRGDFFKKNEEQTFEEHYLRKGVSEYRPFFVKQVKSVYNITFSTIFRMK
ncbi:MAG: hypothetical protein OQJ96_11790 [Flavobacteriales bacterium]|nr:hypothetical protein [Flavobacteriales bacterium]MCW8914011.1 hypothetical protein [Flavobacteriales bacterium]MCW8938593.1 hypothetical protein [Flavobacteriales bacterium]MCW8941155.1 hypothetical protein [Flavobacteriales bacterium]MCW8968859.1 hypothetical protein [Flavobacteriales bacterium]